MGCHDHNYQATCLYTYHLSLLKLLLEICPMILLESCPCSFLKLTASLLHWIWWPLPFKDNHSINCPHSLKSSVPHFLIYPSHYKQMCWYTSFPKKRKAWRKEERKEGNGNWDGGREGKKKKRRKEEKKTLDFTVLSGIFFFILKIKFLSMYLFSSSFLHFLYPHFPKLAII